MIKKIKNKIDTYQITKNFFVDVEYYEGKAEFYLYHRKFGIKDKMFESEIDALTDVKAMIEEYVESCMFDYNDNFMYKDGIN